MKKLTILIVDDERDFLELMALRISNWGYAIAKASDGEEALAAVRKKLPDIIILDYMMPGMDGEATLKEIRKIDKKLPIIMFTAYPNVKTMHNAGKMGVCAFIPKLSAYSDILPSLKSAIEMLEKRLRKGA